jgi:hypothetical protein
MVQTSYLSSPQDHDYMDTRDYSPTSPEAVYTTTYFLYLQASIMALQLLSESEKQEIVIFSSTTSSKPSGQPAVSVSPSTDG